jgi:CHASE2 domain-containing sensor protein
MGMQIVRCYVLYDQKWWIPALPALMAIGAFGMPSISVFGCSLTTIQAVNYPWLAFSSL